MARPESFKCISSSKYWINKLAGFYQRHNAKIGVPNWYFYHSAKNYNGAKNYVVVCATPSIKLLWGGQLFITLYNPILTIINSLHSTHSNVSYYLITHYVDIPCFGCPEQDLNPGLFVTAYLILTDTLNRSATMAEPVKFKFKKTIIFFAFNLRKFSICKFYNRSNSIGFGIHLKLLSASF